MIKRYLERNHIKTRLYEVRYPFENIPSPDEYDYAGFGFPVHAFNAPLMFLRFLRVLPKTTHNKAFVFKTSGEPARLNAEASCSVCRILIKKGFDVVLDAHMLMPYNILFRYPDGLAKQMALYTDALSELLVTRLLNGERDAFRFNRLRRLISLIMRIEWFGAWLNGRLYTVNSQKCSRCLLCVKSCPSANITYDGRFHFGGRCAMCMRCVMYCPKDAIHFGILRPLRVNGGYNLDKLLSDPNVSADFVNDKTRGYFKSFRGFFRRADNTLAAYGLSVKGCAPQPVSDAPELYVFEACEESMHSQRQFLEEEDNSFI